jgi:hypothetical protein
MLAGIAKAGPTFNFGENDKGTVTFEYKGQFQGVARDAGSGPNNDANTYDLNFHRNRLALMGTYGEMMSLYVQTEYVESPNIGVMSVAGTDQGANFQLLDAVMRFHVYDAFRVNVGKFKYNFSRENLEACENPLTLDRSLFLRAPYVGTRDVGVAVWGNVYKDMFQYRVDAMEGRRTLDGTATPKADVRYTARAHVSLLDPESDYGYKGTYLGTKKVFTIGAAIQHEPYITYGDVATQTDPKHYRGWTMDGFLEYPLKGYGTPTISAAYEKVDLGNAYLDFNPDPGVIGLTGQKNGWYLKAGYLIPQLPLQFFGRYDEWRFAELSNIYDQRLDWWGGGANYYIRGQNLKLTVEASRTKFDKVGTFSGPEGTDLTTRNYSSFVGQVQVIF